MWVIHTHVRRFLANNFFIHPKAMGVFDLGERTWYDGGGGVNPR